METTAIEALIAEQYADPDAESGLHDLLAVVAERSGKEASRAEIERGFRFVRSYIELVPYMMKVAQTAAGAVGLRDQMELVLTMVKSYWEQPDDFIPDHLGIIGLLDDAYCSLSSLQTVSDHFQLQTGKYLFPDDLSDANKAMRKIIGEPYSSDLDRLVMRTLQESRLVESLKKMSSAEKQFNFANQSTIWSHGPAGKVDIRDLAGLGLID